MMTALAWALIHSTWQATLLALILLSVRLATRSAPIRYAAGIGALVCMLGCFATTLVLFLPEQTLVTQPGTDLMFSPLSFDAVTAGRVTGAPDRFTAFTPYVAWFWLAGVCLSHVWQLAGMISAARLRRRGVWPAGTRWAARVGDLRERLGVSRPVALLESVMINAPVVIGHLRPVILVPAGLLANLPADQIEAVLLHELAHVRRCDFLVNLFQRWTETLFFYHPAVWWMSRVVRTERENCCDDIAVNATGNRYRYAQALAALEQSRLPQSHPALAASAGPLAGRIHRILASSPGTGVRGVLSSVTLLAASAIFVLAGWPQTQAQAQAGKQVAATPQQGNAAELAGPWNKWLEEDVVYIISDAERTAFNRLASDGERQMFIEEFWRRRGTMANGKSVKDEHYRRIAYANGRFAGSVPGWKTDRGRIYITLGPPYEIESHPSGSGNQPPYEIWVYKPAPGEKGSQSFTFADAENTGDYRLQTPSTLTERPVFNRLIRWTVTDPANRFVTGLDRVHFEVRDGGFRKSLIYFEGPGSPAAVAVCSTSDMPVVQNLQMPGVAQTRTIEAAVGYIASQPAARKAIINAGCPAGTEGAIPGGVFAVNAEPATVSKQIIEVMNQYVGGFMSDSGTGSAVVSIAKQPDGLPPLRIQAPGQ